MTLLGVKDFMEKYGLKDEKIKESDQTRYLNSKVYIRGSKITTNKDLEMSKMANQVVHFGLVFKQKVKNHTFLIVLVDQLKNFYFNNHQNQSFFILINFKHQQ